MKRYNCKNGLMEYYTDPDGYWVTYDDYNKELDAAESVIDRALEDIFDQKYMITDLKEKLYIFNRTLFN